MLEDRLDHPAYSESNNFPFRNLGILDSAVVTAEISKSNSLTLYIDKMVNLLRRFNNDKHIYIPNNKVQKTHSKHLQT